MCSAHSGQKGYEQSAFRSCSEAYFNPRPKDAVGLMGEEGAGGSTAAALYSYAIPKECAHKTARR